MRAPIEIAGFDYYLEDNWDCDGATAVSALTYGNMKVILSVLPDVLSKGSAMAGSADGSIGVYWTVRSPKPNEENVSLYLDLRGNGNMHYYYTDIYGSTVEDTLPNGFSIEELLERITPVLDQFTELKRINWL